MELTFQNDQEMTDADLIEASRGINSLSALQLDGLGITDEALYAIADKASELKSLRISHCPQVSSDGVMRLIRKAGSSLLEVDFSGMRQVDEDAVNLLASSCLFLESLSLENGPEVTDYPIYLLSKHCVSLKHLNLSGNNNVEDDTLEVLANGKFRLEFLSLKGCSDVTEAGLARLKKKQRWLKELQLP